MSSIGEALRRERIRRNLDLDQISTELRISPRFLEAIEEDDFEKLPAGVFAKSFVRQYARLLELDDEEMAAEVGRILEPRALSADAPASQIPPPPDIHVPRVEEWETVGSSRKFQWSFLPSLALVVVVMLVCSGVYAFWQRARRPVTAAQATPPPVQTIPAPAPSAAPPQPVPETPAAKPEGSAGAPAATPTPNPEPAKQAPPQNSAERPAEQPPVKQEAARLANPEPGAAPPPNGANPAAPNPNAQVRVQLTADEPVWVLARADGKYLFSGTIEANQTRSVEAVGVLTLRLGNAGGVNITLNGKPIGAVGPKGQVREVQFTPGGFHIVAAPKPSLPNPI